MSILLSLVAAICIMYAQPEFLGQSFTILGAIIMGFGLVTFLTVAFCLALIILFILFWFIKCVYETIKEEN
jgi:hypothetical protein